MKTRFTILFILIFSSNTFFDLNAKEPNWKQYNHILKNNVSSRKISGITLHFVNYSNIKRSSKWKKIVKQMSTFKRSSLKTRNEKMAFYINVYNIFIIDLIIQNNIPSNINKIGKGVWKQKFIKLEKNVYSLDSIEHKIIRPMGDPRIHFALVCAALSCPDLRKEAYTARELNSQLHLQTRGFINNETKGVKIDYNASPKVMHVSKVFEWFKIDFEPQGVLSFIGKYNKRIPKNGKLVSDIHYNWKLNGK